MPWKLGRHTHFHSVSWLASCNVFLIKKNLWHLNVKTLLWVENACFTVCIHVCLCYSLLLNIVAQQCWYVFVIRPVTRGGLGGSYVHMNHPTQSPGLVFWSVLSYYLQSIPQAQLAKMCRIRWRLTLRPRPHWGSLQRSPRPIVG